ncbi:hypothetical protein [Singulisphaera sp. PoT]|uniref:hypothetical protein n=1 Tax=Singulisphaera sp. PoT TaxID=3411797 RepID=UPI003BF4EDF8
MRRRLCFPAVVAAALALSNSTSLLRADTISTASYTLTAPGGLPDPDPNSPSPQVIANVVPTGGVIVPPSSSSNPNSNPLSILSDSHGFDQSQLLVGLKDTGATPDQQLFGLAFNNGGLEPGGVLHFTLSIDGALSTPPDLVSLTPGVTITRDQPAPTGPSTPPPTDPPSVPSDPNTNPTPVNTPEPMSVLTWSILAGLGLVRVRAVRKSRLKVS